MEPSLADIWEAEFVDRILGDHTWRQVIGVPPGTPDDALSTVRRDLPCDDKGRRRGDVDILLMPPAQPELATAIEVKRVKVGQQAFKTGMPNRLANLREGLDQANRLAALGFHRVFFYILIAIDSRDNNQGKWVYAGITPELLGTIRSAYDIRSLDPRVGVVEAEFAQPVDREPFLSGTVGWNFVRHAISADQNPSITQWVSAQYENPAA